MNKKLILLFILFLLVQLPIVFYATIPADENVLYATSRAVSQGYKIYQDFFHGHPPLHPHLYSFLIDIFGMRIWVLKLFTLMIYFGCGYLVFLISKEKYGEKAGLISFFLFMTCYDALFASFSFGIELSLICFLLSYYYLNKNNYISGLFYALSIAVRLHLGFLGLPLLLFSKEKRKFLLGASVSIIYYALLFRLVPESIPQILGYHMAKSYFLGGWFSYLKSSIHLLILFFFSIKYIKDVKLVFIGITYLFFLLLIHSIFQYYFFLVTVVLCIEGSNALVSSKQKKLLWFMVFLFIFLLIFRAVPFLYKNTQGYNEFADYIRTLEKPLVGQSSIVSLLALKTGKEISGLQIDTNYQRRQVYDYSNAIVVYERDVFTGYLYNCSLLKEVEIEKKDYLVWDC